MLTIDASALVAIVTGEDDAETLLDKVVAAPQRNISALNVLEARLVIAFGRNRDTGLAETFLATWNVEIVPLDAGQLDRAFDAYRRYGKGRHPAKLNMGDCAAYALARSRGWPLLYKGEDFAQTDIERA